jgi:MFS family permease
MRTKPNPALVETAIPARLDRLRWGQFHTLVVVALGITWILDGLEVTLAGAVAGALKESPTLNLTNAEVGLASSFYLAGAVLGALLFGWLTDRLGRKRLFFITLTVYLLATTATAFSWDFLSFALFRFLTGAGIGGEYTAFRSSCRHDIAAGPTSSSTAASGLGRPSAPAARSCYSTPHFCRLTSAGAPPSSSARCWGSSSS